MGVVRSNTVVRGADVKSRWIQFTESPPPSPVHNLWSLSMTTPTSSLTTATSSSPVSSWSGSFLNSNLQEEDIDSAKVHRDLSQRLLKPHSTNPDNFSLLPHCSGHVYPPSLITHSNQTYPRNDVDNSFLKPTSDTTRVCKHVSPHPITSCEGNVDCAGHSTGSSHLEDWKLGKLIQERDSTKPLNEIPTLRNRKQELAYRSVGCLLGKETTIELPQTSSANTECNQPFDVREIREQYTIY